MRLGVHIGDVSHLVNGPTLDRIEVIDRSEGTVRSADSDQLPEYRLDVTGLVGAATLQNGGLAVPHPRIAEANRADRLGRDVELRGTPGLAAIDGDIHRLHAAAPAPGESSDVVEAWSRQFHVARRESDNGFCFHLHGELP